MLSNLILSILNYFKSFLYAFPRLDSLDSSREDDNKKPSEYKPVKTNLKEKMEKAYSLP